MVFLSCVLILCQGQTKVIVGKLYCVPNCKVNQSIEYFNHIINKLKTTKCNVITGSDQNFDLLKYNSNKYTEELLDSFIGAG